MAYNTTDKDKQLAAAKDTAAKIKRERILMAALLAGYFLPIAREFERMYRDTRGTPNMLKHELKLNEILNKNYTATSNKFINQVRKALGEPVNATEINNQIVATQKVTQLRDIHLSRTSIANTTKDTLNNALQEIIVSAAAAGIPLTNKDVAKQTKDKFITDSKGRLPTIGITQTQQAAENAKHVEMDALVRNNAVFVKAGIDLAKDKIEKTWVPILDSRTRAAHAAADLQTVDFNGVYTVGGQQLRFPGDTSLGATPNNTINCRCSSVKSIKRS